MVNKIRRGIFLNLEHFIRLLSDKPNVVFVFYGYPSINLAIRSNIPTSDVSRMSLSTTR